MESSVPCRAPILPIAGADKPVRRPYTRRGGQLEVRVLMKHRFAVALAGAAAVLVGGGALALGAASSLPKANLTVAQTAGMRSAAPGQVVRFTSFAVNLGP